MIDDDAAVRHALRFALETEGYDVLTHDSAAAFLAVPAPSTRACLLIDQHMPGMSGLELAAALRAGGSTLPIVLMTASPTAQLRQGALLTGVCEIVEKPLLGNALSKALARLAGN
ncbi:MAG: response regulator [Alphaproteobacteria bacterium]|nr:MAG: response regulator [Alphaproteobacteria bacterium]